VRLAQKDTDARWTVKHTMVKPREDTSVPTVDLAIPSFDCKNHIAVDPAYGLIRKWTTTHPPAHFMRSNLAQAAMDGLASRLRASRTMVAIATTPAAIRPAANSGR